ncbi:MAG: S8 family serine peptidase [Okeania sp. SIO3I5]|uniref:S8 family serine peptidase n=1 Tax=Okeania sp. SIO3I5 TaxID=2607805 RepID=UPI0013B6F479|nr:S8 family serine peptidase [Okeania sp. SIO3I5]NEQ39120.1 S8 family serine peptidase [Okeania sp. SIO3I5]
MVLFWNKKSKQKQQKKSAKKPRSKTFILEEIISPGAYCLIPIDNSLVNHPIFGLFTDQELITTILGTDAPLDIADLDTESLVQDYWQKIDKYFQENPTTANSFDLEDLSTWPTLEALINPGQPSVEIPDIGGVVDTLPPPTTLPIDPPRNNYGQDNNHNKDYDFPVGNQPLIGVIDRGLAPNNPDIDYNRITTGYDMVSFDNNSMLKPGTGDQHGTHVLGIIGATRDNGIGIDGINDKAPLWVSRGIGYSGWASSLRLFVNHAKQAGQKNAVVNLSLDLTQKNPDDSITTRYKLTPFERKAIKYAQDNGVLIVAAAGNDGGVMSALGQASQEFDNIITVGAADGEDRAAYSSYGNGLDILAEGGTADNPVTSTADDGLGTMAGTSVATAKVTGAASLVWAANPNLNFTQVKEILKATAKDVGAAGWDQETGAGLLDMDKAVERAKVTGGRIYRPQQSLISDKWDIDNGVKARSRAVQNYRIKSPWGRRIYDGYLYSRNPEDRLYFYLGSSTNLQLGFPNTGGQVKVYRYDRSGRSYLVKTATRHPEGGLYLSADLERGDYYIKLDKNRRSTIDYELRVNFGHQSTNRVHGRDTVSSRPILRKEPSFNKPTPKPSKDYAQIQRELQEKARRDRERRERENREREKRQREQQEKREAETNARNAIRLVENRNPWLGRVEPNGQRRRDVELDWDTQMDNRVAAIKYFDNGYIIWNGIHAVAYREGSGLPNGVKAQADPRQVRLHDWGLHNGRDEYGTYIAELERDDYYKFSVEKLEDFVNNKHKLQFAMRNSRGQNISSQDAQFQILDENFDPISLKAPWQPEKNTGAVGLAYLDTSRNGETYYVRVEPKKQNLDYQVIMNLDSAGQDHFDQARNVGALRGRQHFQDYIGYKGDAHGDYYKFYLQDKSFLRFSLGDLEPGSQIKAEILDQDNRVLPLNYFDGTYGDVTLDEGHYYLRLLPEGDTSTNYVLTTQMSEELGEFNGRHEFQNRSVGEDEAFYRFTVGDGVRDFHLKSKQKQGNVYFELRRDRGGGIVNSEFVTPHFTEGDDNLYARYENLPPGNYMVRVFLEDDSPSGGKYDLVMNMDQAGNSLETARDLGDVSGKRLELEDFVGWNKGDNVDFYKFTTDNREFRLQFALRELTAGPHIDVLDENGNVISLLEFDEGGGDRYGNVVIPPNGNYYLRVKAPDNRGDSTNYKLVVNATDDVGIVIDGHKVDGNIYKLYKDGEIRGILGKPTGGVQHYDGSDFQIFERGSIVSSSHGTFPLHGSIREYYLETDGIKGPLGPPTTGEYPSSTGIRQDFAHGYITWNGSSYEGFDKDGVPLFGGGGGATSEAMERFFREMNGERGIRRADEDFPGQYQGECVTLIARYLQDVFLETDDERTRRRYYGDGKDTARNVASQFKNYFGPYTTTGWPSYGAVISFPGTEGVPEGHTGIVMESRRNTNTREIEVRILESNGDRLGASSEVGISGWKSVKNANGWTNPKVETANGSTGGNSSGSNAGSSSGSNNSGGSNAGDSSGSNNSDDGNSKPSPEPLPDSPIGVKIPIVGYEASRSVSQEVWLPIGKYLVEGEHKIKVDSALKIGGSDVILDGDNLQINNLLGNLLTVEFGEDKKVSLGVGDDLIELSAGIDGNFYTGKIELKATANIFQKSFFNDGANFEASAGHTLDARYHRKIEGTAPEKVVKFVNILVDSVEELKTAYEVFLDQNPDVEELIKGIADGFGYLVGAAAIITAVVGAVWFIGNNITGVGFLDDIVGYPIVTGLVAFALAKFGIAEKDEVV